MRYTSKTAEETEKIGEEFARKLKPGDIVLLYGDLGFGKTTFVKGIAKGLGIKSRIISPTFVVIRQHKFKSQNANVKSAAQKLKVLNHIDLYRLEKQDQLEEAGIKEILEDTESIKLIEWPEKLGNLPKKRIEVKFRLNKNDARTLNIIDHE